MGGDKPMGTPRSATDLRRKSGTKDARGARVFQCTPSGDLYTLVISESGAVRNRILLTADEVRACADTLLASLGWTPYHKDGDAP